MYKLIQLKRNGLIVMIAPHFEPDSKDVQDYNGACVLESVQYAKPTDISNINIDNFFTMYYNQEHINKKYIGISQVVTDYRTKPSLFEEIIDDLPIYI